MGAAEKLIIDPDKIRRSQSVIIDIIREKSLPPSSIIKVIEGETDLRMKEAMSSAFDEFAPSELKEKVEKVKIAFQILEEFDKI